MKKWQSSDHLFPVYAGGILYQHKITSWVANETQGKMVQNPELPLRRENRLTDKPRRSQNYCPRFVYYLEHVDHITPFYIRSKFNSLIYSRNINIISLNHLVLHTGQQNTFLKNMNFLSDMSVRTSRKGSALLRMPLRRTTLHGKCFKVSAFRLWNYLPFPLKDPLRIGRGLWRH